MGKSVMNGIGGLSAGIILLGLALECFFNRGTGPGPGQAAVDAAYQNFAATHVVELRPTPEFTPYAPVGEDVYGRVDNVRDCGFGYVCADMTSQGDPLTLMINSACGPYPELGEIIIAEDALRTSFPGQYKAKDCPGWEYFR